MNGKAFLRGDEAEDGRIDIARPRSHHQSFERRHAHGGVHGTPAANGRSRASIAEVQADDIGLLARQIAHRAVAIRHVAVGDAVKSVPANPVAQVEMIRNRVQIGALRRANGETPYQTRRLAEFAVPASSRMARIPRRLVGLCSGARSMQFSIPFMTSSLMRTESVKISPP